MYSYFNSPFARARARVCVLIYFRSFFYCVDVLYMNNHIYGIYLAICKFWTIICDKAKHTQKKSYSKIKQKTKKLGSDILLFWFLFLCGVLFGWLIPCWLVYLLIGWLIPQVVRLAYPSGWSFCLCFLQLKVTNHVQSVSSTAKNCLIHTSGWCVCVCARACVCVRACVYVCVCMCVCS